MSSFIVENKTIDRIVSLLAERYNEYLERINFPVESQTQLGKELLKMNCDAFFQRYGEKYHKAVEKYSYTAVSPFCSEIQKFKSLQCCLYQCLEGDVSERPLYKALSEIETAFAMGIVISLCEYEKAEWG